MTRIGNWISPLRSPIHKDLRTPKYKPRIVPNKKRKFNKRWARNPKR
jgi:hypothetical protein